MEGQARQLLPRGGTRAWRPAKRIHLGVVPEMFQPLAVRLDHALNADTVGLGDPGVGALQEVELLTGKGRREGTEPWRQQGSYFLLAVVEFLRQRRDVGDSGLGTCLGSRPTGL